MYTGPNIERDGLVFGYDTGYGVADNSTVTRFYPGEPTINGIMYPDFSSGVSPYSTHTVTVQDSSEALTVKSLKIQLTGVNGANRTQFSEESSFNTPQTAIMSVYAKGEGSSIGKYLQTYSGASWTYGIGPLTSEYRRFSVSIITGGGSGGPGNIGLQNGEVGQTFYIHSPQLEAKSHVTPFTDGTRSSTQSLIDLIKTTDIDVSNVSFDSTGQPTFDGTDDYIDLPNDLGYDNEVSIFAVFKSNGTPAGGYHIICGGGELEISIPTAGQLRTGIYTTSRYVNNLGSGLTDGNYHHIGFTFSNNTKTAYIDGVSVGTQSTSGNLTNSFSNRTLGRFGSSSFYYLNGELPVLKIYNRALSAAEVQQNFKAYKNRFNM